MSNIERKARFTSDWLDANWGKFVAEGVEDSNGRLVRVSDAIPDILAVEMKMLDEAFALGMCATHNAIEKIAKAYLIEMVVNDMWYNHLAEEEEAGHEIEWAKP